MVAATRADAGGVALVISSLSMGGAQRALTTLADGWRRRGRPVAVVVLGSRDPTPFFPLPEGVRLVGLDACEPSGGTLDALRKNAHRVSRLRAALRAIAPDAVVSFMDQTNVAAILASRGLPAAVVVAERTDPDRRRLPAVWEGLRAITYPHADAIVVQTEAVRRRVAERWGAPVTVIPNPVAAPPADARPARAASAAAGTIVSAGRLEPAKGFDVLLDAFATIATRHPGWSLAIWGEGPERAELEERRDRLGLAGRAEFRGTYRSPAEAFADADLFVLASRREGFPNALCEAMAWGLPVVAADCASGPAEIVTGGFDGVLVPPEDPAALARSMEALVARPERRAELAARARGIADRLSLERVLERWNETLAAARERRARRGLL